MSLDYNALKAADAALNPPQADPAAAAAALNAQTITSGPTDFSAISALNILLISGEWPKVIIRTEARPLDAIVGAALSATTLLQARGIISGTDETAWAAFIAALNGLQSVGDISAASVAAIEALRTPTKPAWPVVLTDNDIIAARGLA